MGSDEPERVARGELLMAVDKLVDSSQLDSDLTSVANAIRAKSGGSGQLAFPNGFISAVEAIPTGGGGSNNKADMFPIPDGYSLPSNYQKLVCCDSSGTQICNTGVVATINTKIELVGYFIPGTYSGYGYMVGSITPNLNIATEGVSSARWFGFGNKSDFWSLSAAQNVNFGIPSWTMSAEEARIQNNPLIDASKACGATTMSGATNPICIFGRRNGSTNERFSSVRFFRMRIWESDALVRCIFPVLKDGEEVCLYDVVNGIYIPNIGTGVLSGVM